MSSSTIQVYHDGQFFVCLYQRYENGTLQVCRILFAHEPSDAELWAYLLVNHNQLRFGLPVNTAMPKPAAQNPKRRQREAARLLQQAGAGIGTKAQQALAATREAGRQGARQKAGKARQQRAAQQFARRQEKKKQKHRGH